MKRSNKPVYKTRIFWASILFAQFILFQILQRIPQAVSLFTAFFQRQKGLHQQLFGGVPFSVGDVLYILIILAGMALLYKSFSSKKALRSLLILINCVFFFYQIFWGMMYFRPPLDSRLPSTTVELDNLKDYAYKYLRLATAARARVAEDNDGVFRISDPELKKHIVDNQRNLPAPFNDNLTNKVVSVKESLYSGILSQTGILGYYNPFTAEAQFNKHLPHSFVPATIAHEAAHQLGYAREQEASFIGFLNALQSDNPDLQYSNYLFVLKNLLANIKRHDKDFVKNFMDSFPPALHRDINAEQRFVDENRSWLAAVLSVTNNLFLKINGQEGSVTYNHFVRLLDAYEKQKRLHPKMQSKKHK